MKFSHVDLAYKHIVSEVLDKGTRKENRTGVDTMSTFGVHYNLDLTRGFPLLTTKKISWKNIVVEMLWFLSGQTDISILKRHGCGFWDAWADSEGKVPSAYGNFWRHFPVHQTSSRTLYNSDGKGIVKMPDVVEPTFNDQIAWVLAEMVRNPMSRRMVVSAWAPGNAQTSKLPPCHSLFVFNVQEESTKPRYVHYGHNMGRDPVCCYEGDPDAGVNGQGGTFGILPHGEGMRAPFLWCPKCQSIMQTFHGADKFQNPTEPVDLRRLCLHLTQRSCDVALGVPYNIASYALLMHLASRISGIPVGTFSHTLVDAHVYTAKPDGSMADHDHVPGLTQQVLRPYREMPQLVIDPSIQMLADIEALMAPDVTTEHILSMFKLENYDPHPAVSFKVAV